MSLHSTVQKGDTRKSLEAIRDKLASLIDDPETEPTAVASLSRRLEQLLVTIDKLPKREAEGTAHDEAIKRAQEKQARRGQG